MDELTQQLFRCFGWDGLPLPPVSEDCLARLRFEEPHTFTTETADPAGLYFFDAEAGRLLAAPCAVQPDITVSFWGHGLNSYAWTVRLRQPGLRLLVQEGFGGLYAEGDYNRNAVRAMFDEVRLLQRRAPDFGRSGDLALLSSSFRGVRAGGWWLGPVDDAEEWMRDHRFTVSVEEGLDWLLDTEPGDDWGLLAGILDKDMGMLGWGFGEHRSLSIGPYYLQYARTGDGDDGGDGIHAEVISDRFLPESSQYTADQRRALLALGWQPPDDHIPNWWVESKDLFAVGRMLTDTWQHVWQQPINAAGTLDELVSQLDEGGLGRR